VSRRVSAPWPLTGIATVEADVRGRLGAPEISGRVSIPRLTAKFIHARTVVLRGQWGTAGLAIQLKGDVDLAPIGREFIAQWPLTGIATVEADVRGRLDAPEISGRVTVPRLAAGVTQARDVAVRGQWRQGVLDLPEVTARIFEGNLRGSLRMEPDKLDETRVTLVLQRSSIAAFESIGPIPDGLDGELDLEADIQGDPRRPEEARGRFRLAASRFVPPGDLSRIGAGTLSVAGTFQQDVAELTQVSGRWPGVRLEASGRLGRQGPRGMRLALDADLSRVGPLWGVAMMAGQATLTGAATGRWADPEFAGEASAAPVTIAGVALDSLRVRCQLDGTRLTVQSADAVLGQSRAHAAGTVTWREVRFRADVIAPSLFWEDFRPWLPPAAQGTGRLGLAGRVEGGPAAWQAEGTIEAPALALREVPIRDLHGTFAATPERIEIAKFRARVHGIPVAGAGTFGWDGNGRAAADVGPADLAAAPFAPETAGLRGMGRAQVSATIRAGAVAASGRLALEGAAVGDIPLGSGTGQFELRDNRLQASLTLPESRVSAAVQGAVDGAQPLAVRVEAEEVALAPLLGRVERLREANLDGTLTARADVLVPLSQPSAARGSLTIRAARLLVAGDEWTNRGPVTLRWEPNLLTIESLHLTSRLGDLHASGRVDPWGAINVQVDGRFPLRLLPALRPEIREAGGTLVVTGQIGGTVAAPQPVGEATIQGGTLQLRDRPETLREIEARILVSAAGLRLVEATASLGRGRVRANGELALAGWRPQTYRVVAAGTNVAIAPFDGLQTTWDLDLELVGQGNRNLLRGEGRLLQGRYTGRLNLVSMLLSRQVEPAADVSPAMPIHITLKLNNNLRVDTNWARMQVGGRLSLEGTTAMPVVLGSLESEEGRITFRKHRWTVSSAAVRFADPRRIDPILDVTGRALIKQYDVTLHLSGRLDELTFRFSSVPPLKQQELLSLVTVGTTSATAGGAFGEVVQLLAEDVVGVATAGYAPETFGIEQTDKKEQMFSVGKQVTEDVRVLYSQSISGASKRVLRVEYQVIGPLLLSADQDFQGGFGGDVLIRLRFR
jgi:autotransporter translocation and assembly factor TamB